MSSFCRCKSYSHFFSRNISIYATFNDQSFNATLTNDIVSFEQLGPDALGDALESEKVDCIKTAEYLIVIKFTKNIKHGFWTHHQRIGNQFSWSRVRPHCMDHIPLDLHITKTYLYNFEPLKHHLYTGKLGFTGLNIIFLISAQNTDCGYSLEPPRRGGSNEYPQYMFWGEI